MYWDYSYRILHGPPGPRFEVLLDKQPWSEALGFGNDLILTPADGAAFLSAESIVQRFAYSKGAKPPDGEIIEYVPRDDSGRTIPGRPEVAVMKVDSFTPRGGKKVDQPVLRILSEESLKGYGWAKAEALLILKDELVAFVASPVPEAV